MTQHKYNLFNSQKNNKNTELRLGTTSIIKKHVVYARVTCTAKGRVRFEHFLLPATPGCHDVISDVVGRLPAIPTCSSTQENNVLRVVWVFIQVELQCQVFVRVVESLRFGIIKPDVHLGDQEKTFLDISN